VPYKDPKSDEALANRRKNSLKYRAAHLEKERAKGREYETRRQRPENYPDRKATTGRVRNMVARPEQYRKAYDPNHPYGPKRLLDGEWVRLAPSECTFLPAPDKSPAAHLAAALIVIDERLNYHD
jgi:hypothetical protein